MPVLRTGGDRMGARSPRPTPAYVIVYGFNSPVANDAIHVWALPEVVRVKLNDAAAAGVGLVPAGDPAGVSTIAVPAEPTVAPVEAGDAETGKKLTEAAQAFAALAESGIDCPLVDTPEDPSTMEVGPTFESREYTREFEGQEIVLSLFADHDTLVGAMAAIASSNLVAYGCCSQEWASQQSSYSTRVEPQRSPGRSRAGRRARSGRLRDTPLASTREKCP